MRRRQILFSFKLSRPDSELASDNHAAAAMPLPVTAAVPAADEQQADAAHGATEAPNLEVLVAGAPAPKAPPSAVPIAEQPLPMTASDAAIAEAYQEALVAAPLWNRQASEIT